MNRCLLSVLACGLLVGQASPAAGPPATSSLKGEWAVVVWDYEGFWFTACDGPIGDHYRDLRFIFTSKRVKIALRENGQKLPWTWFPLDGIESAYKINPTREPKEIDFDKDSFFGTGIYCIRGDRLFICLARGEGAKRPATFEIKPNGADTLILLERVKKRGK
jgi:uncharacterized protein (TIGR03067 family)